MKSVIFSISRLFFTALFLFGFLTASSAYSAGPDGSFNYSIPIELPQGTAGMAPKLTLVYNSNSGNSMLGMGWRLAGLPAITRDTTHPVNYDGSDHYIGPGGRLVYISSGDLTGDFHYENESFCRIEQFGTQGDGPDYWIETKPDGTKYYYGYTDAECADTNSKIRSMGPVQGRGPAWELLYC